MALSPLAFISPGCSAQCHPCVAAKSDSFAFASVQSISLFQVTTTNVEVPSGDANQANALQQQQQQQSLETVSVAAYPLRTLFGHGVNTAISSFAYNDEYMACLTPQNKQVLLWRLKDSESLTAKKITTTSLAALFKRDGNPSVMCLAGKHHILCGTNTGHLISLNTALDHAEPNSVAIPVAQRSGRPKSPLSTASGSYSTYLNTANASTSDAGSPARAVAVESVECVVASAARPDTVACGTADGTLCILSLNASTGLRPVASFCPFPPREKSTSMEAGALPVTVLAFDPTSAQYIAVGSHDGALALYDTSSNAVVQSFDYAKLPEEHVSCIAWVPGEAGVFYTASRDSKILRKWSTSSKSFVGSVSIMMSPPTCTAEVAQQSENGDDADVSVGICSIAFIDQQRIVVGMTNGAVKVYNMAQQQLEFDGTTGHTDTTLHANFSKHDRDQVATCGVDGTIRVWNLRSLATSYVIPVGHVMVYSVDWSPNGKHLVAALGSGEVVMYSTSTQRESWRTPVFSDLVYRVAWAGADSSLIAATSRSGVVLMSSKDGKVIRRYPSTRGAFYGVDIEHVKSKAMAVGCHDHRIYIYQFASSSDRPALVLSGHTDAVCDIAFNPTAPSYLLSGSYDGTVRVWDLSSNDAHTISVSSRALKGHSDRVRSVAWCTLAPYLALSGSADASIRLWDIRNGVPITTVRGHNSDVVSLTSHPERPLIFLSAGRDSTVAVWSVGLLRQVYLDAALGTLEQSIVADPSSLMGVSTSNVSVSQVAGVAVQQLVKELAECAAKPAERMEKLIGFFEFPNGAAEVAQMSRYAVDPSQYATLMADTKNSTIATTLVIPPPLLATALQAQARYISDKAHSKTVTSAGPVYKKTRLLEAAEELLRVGQLEPYCAALMEAEEWDRAIAVAPAISRAYWRHVCLKAAEAMEAAGDARAVTYYIIGEESNRAARAMTKLSPSNYDAASVICQTCPQSSVESDPNNPQQNAEPSHNTTVDTNSVTAYAKDLQKYRTASLKRYRNPQLLAAALLASGHNDEAVAMLQSCGDVVLSHLLVHTVPLRAQLSIDNAYRLSMLQSVRQHKWDTAVLCASRQSNPYDGLATLIALYQNAQGKQLAGKVSTQSLTSGNLTTFHAVSERLKGFYEQVRAECNKLQLPMDGNAIQQRHANDGLASQNQLAAMVIAADPSSGPTTSSDILQSLSGFMESLLTVAMQDVDGANTPFYLRQAYNVSAYVSLPLDVPVKGGNGGQNGSAGQPAPPQGSSMSPEHKQFLALVYLVAALFTVKVYRFPTLLSPAFTKALDLANSGAVSSSLAALINKAQSALGTYSPHSTEVDCTPLGSTLPALSSEGKQITSMLSGQPICGAVHVLEDSSSFISKADALAWTMCCHFSPLATGARLTIF